MPAPLRKQFPNLDLERAQAQVCRAIQRAIQMRGGQVKFTRDLNALLVAARERPITRQAVMWWASEGTFLDRWMWPHFELLTDMAVTRRHLRPDKYGILSENDI